MGYSYYDHFGDSGQGQFWDQYKNWLDENAPKKGRYYKQIMRDPANSSLATASLASTARAQKLAEQNYTVDPEIAKNAPEVLAGQINKQKQDIASAGSADFMNALADTQRSLYGLNQARKLAIYQEQSAARRAELEERARQMQAVQKRNPWLSALGMASPFLGLIPGVGPVLSAAAGAASSAG